MNELTQFVWTELYRPSTVQVCVLPERIKNYFQKMVDQGFIDQHMLLVGPPGSGKTSVAEAMCMEMNLDYTFINASKERNIDTVKTTITAFASTYSMSGKPKVIILDEADHLTLDAQGALRGTIEEFSSNCLFVFTCNNSAKIMDAIQSRLAVVDFRLQKAEVPVMAKEFMEKMFDLLKKAGVEFEKKAVASVVKKFMPDYRKIINNLQYYNKMGGIREDVVTNLMDPKNLKTLYSVLAAKDFKKMREWVSANIDLSDAPRMYEMIYDEMGKYFTPETVPVVLLLINKYQVQSTLAINQQINLEAFLTDVMTECEIIQ